VVIALVDVDAVCAAAAAAVCLFMAFAAAIRRLFVKRFFLLSAAVAA
jgi:hypothetical protein